MQTIKAKLVLCIACALLAATAEANASPYVVTLEQVGSNVVATGSGEFDLIGLTSAGPYTSSVADLNAAWGYINTGSSVSLDGYTGFTGPSNFGPGPLYLASSSSGGSAEIYALGGLFWVPSGYVSGTALSDTATYGGSTWSGVTPGTYQWTWGNSPDQSFTLIIGQTPIPATLPLFASGLGALGLLGWRRKRKAQATA